MLACETITFVFCYITNCLCGINMFKTIAGIIVSMCATHDTCKRSRVTRNRQSMVTVDPRSSQPPGGTNLASE